MAEPEDTKKKPEQDEEDEIGIRISTDGGIAMSIGDGLTIDTHGHLGFGIGGLSIPFGGKI